MINQADKVESYFGYWPLFCDAKITNFAFSRPGTVVMAISYFDAEKNIGAEVALQFSGVTELELSELRSENVIDELRISEDLQVQVIIETCYGVHGGFTCASVEVLSVTPNPAFQRTASGGR